MKHRPSRSLLALLVAIVAVLVVFALRLAAGETPSFHFGGLVFGALVIIAVAVVILLVVGYGVLAVVRAGTREFNQRHVGELSIRVRNVAVGGERLPLPYYRFLTADTDGIHLWSHAQLGSSDGSFAAAEISLVKRGDRDSVVALGADENPIVEFEVVPTKPLALRSVNGTELVDLIASLNARLRTS